MKVFALSVSLAALMIIPGLNYSGLCYAETSFTEADLIKILDDGWQNYKADKPGFNGGLALQLMSPKGNFYVSTGMEHGVTNSSRFRIASVTKTFTAAGIMLLHQKRQLNIDDKITAMIPGKDVPYVPDTPDYNIPFKDKITIRMLLMHRGGVFDVSNNAVPENEFSKDAEYAGQNYIDYMENKDEEHTFTFDELVGINAKNHLSFFEPGTGYHYSDTGYSILGKIIERVSGRSYEEYIKEELLRPNGLLNTSLPSLGTDRALIEPFIKGYVWAGEKPEDVTVSNMSPHVAEGNIVATPTDLALWCQKLFRGEAGLRKETVKKMMSGKNREDGTDGSYGLGIGYFPGVGYGHAGAHAGYLTLMYYDPETDSSIVMLTNEWNCQKGLDTITEEVKYMMEIAGKILEKIK